MVPISKESIRVRNETDLSSFLQLRSIFRLLRLLCVPEPSEKLLAVGTLNRCVCMRVCRSILQRRSENAAIGLCGSIMQRRSENAAIGLSMGAAAVACATVAYHLLGQRRQRQRLLSHELECTSRQQDAIRKYDIPEAFLSSPLRFEMQVAVRLALQAGNAMFRYCDEKGTAAEATHDLDIATKGQAEDFCTRIDMENEQLITHGLLEHFPSHTVIGEETTGTGEIPRLSSHDPTWIIDPIDGTTNFAAGIPFTCVSIGLCLNGKPALAVVYAPMTGELYLALDGLGSYRNGTRIAPPQNKKNNSDELGKKLLINSVVCFEFGYARDHDAIEAIVGVVQRVLRHGCRTTRSLGSGVLNLCYVATGRIDVVYAGVAGEGWKPWDYCAGSLIAKESGCAIEPIVRPKNESLNFDLYSDSVICAVNQSLLEELRTLILKT